jgi:hypothetical protein
LYFGTEHDPRFVVSALKKLEDYETKMNKLYPEDMFQDFPTKDQI